MVEFSEIISSVLKLGLEGGLLLLFVWYFLKRDKEREDSLVDEKCKQREEAKKQKEDLQKEMESYKTAAREKEALLMSENAKREELIRKESEKREQLLREESEKREQALLSQLADNGTTLKEISEAMRQINKAMDSMNRTNETIMTRLDKIEEKVSIG
jgi:hypothetical protein